MSMRFYEFYFALDNLWKSRIIRAFEMVFSGNGLALEEYRRVHLCVMITLLCFRMEDPSSNLHILIDFFFLSQKEQQQKVHFVSTVFQLLSKCIYQIVHPL